MFMFYVYVCEYSISAKYRPFQYGFFNIILTIHDAICDSDSTTVFLDASNDEMIYLIKLHLQNVPKVIMQRFWLIARPLVIRSTKFLRESMI